jgi:hypothetical protein
VRVICPICKRRDFETTAKYVQDVTPNGSFVKCLLPYIIDWLTTSTTLCSEMTCPECGASLAPSGRLTVIPDPIIPVPPEMPDIPSSFEPLETGIKKRRR